MTESGRGVRGEVGERAERLLLGIAKEAAAPVVENQDQTPSLREIRTGDDGRRLIAGSFAPSTRKPPLSKAPIPMPERAPRSTNCASDLPDTRAPASAATPAAMES